MPTRDVVIDRDFPSAAAGRIDTTDGRHFDIQYEPEPLPDWFAALLDKHFAGRGVPKEYMFHVRVRNEADAPRQITLRFHFSPLGASYLALPWWMRRDGRWQHADNVILHERDKDYTHIDITLDLRAHECIYVASAPYDDPAAVDARTREAAQLPGWSLREIGRTARERPLLALEANPGEPCEMTLLVSATMQGCEPAWDAIIHAAHAWTLDIADITRLRERVRLCLLPLTNPDGLAAGRSVTNAVGEVPKFGFGHVAAGRDAPRETQALWDYMAAVRPDVCLEVHAHFTQPGFARSVGMQTLESAPPNLRDKAAALSDAFDAQYHGPQSKTRRIRIDPTRPGDDIYGITELNNHFAALQTFIQAESDTLDIQRADVWSAIVTHANALLA
jgi:hypothetical protein